MNTEQQLILTTLEPYWVTIRALHGDAWPKVVEVYEPHLHARMAERQQGMLAAAIGLGKDLVARNVDPAELYAVAVELIRRDGLPTRSRDRGTTPTDARS